MANKPLRVASVMGTCGDGVVETLCGLADVEFKWISSVGEAMGADFDRLILLGGSDLNPGWYGQPSTYSQPANKQRDATEWALVRRALAFDKPTLGICRGHQMLAVAAGGILWQDIERDGVTREHKSSHRLSDVLLPLSAHIPGGAVNSYHHQAVRVVPYGWLVAAHSPDGVVESIYRPGMLGVQWHPEMLVTSNPAWEKLFKWFLQGLR